MSNNTILITGASGGLGVTVVAFFLAKGFRVIAVVAHEDHRKLLGADPRLDIQVVDLANEEAAAAFIGGQIRAGGGIDAALLLAGGFMAGGVAEAKGADIKRMMTLNFDTAFNIARPLYEDMLARGKGRIVLIGSRPALEPAQGKAVLAYALSKSLLFRLAEVMNAGAKGKDVVVHVVVPSTIDTPDNRKSMPNVDPDNWVRPEQLAEIFYCICSEVGSPLREPVWKLYKNA